MNLNKRLKAVEEKIGKIKETDLSKFNASVMNLEVTSIVDEHTQYRIKKA